MLPSETPFPCYWWGTDLEIVGLGDVRPRVSTYGRYAFDALPPLPFELRGDFAWLATAPVHSDSIGDEKAAENAAAAIQLGESSARLGIRLPTEFTYFFERPALHQRIWSCTDCFLDLCSEPVASPIGAGYLVRFLADSQSCVFWYLYVERDRSDHAVVTSTDFYGSEAEQWNDDPPDPDELAFSAESFEAFMCRFWLENEIWYAGWKQTPIPEAGREYIERYRRK